VRAALHAGPGLAAGVGVPHVTVHAHRSVLARAVVPTGILRRVERLDDLGDGPFVPPEVGARRVVRPFARIFVVDADPVDLEQIGEDAVEGVDPVAGPRAAADQQDPHERQACRQAAAPAPEPRSPRHHRRSGSG
jgi:hypothetical protein